MHWGSDGGGGGPPVRQLAAASDRVGGQLLAGRGGVVAVGERRQEEEEEEAAGVRPQGKEVVVADGVGLHRRVELVAGLGEGAHSIAMVEEAILLLDVSNQ